MSDKLPLLFFILLLISVASEYDLPMLSQELFMHLYSIEHKGNDFLLYLIIVSSLGHDNLFELQPLFLFLFVCLLCFYKQLLVLVNDKIFLFFPQIILLSLKFISNLGTCVLCLPPKNSVTTNSSTKNSLCLEEIALRVHKNVQELLNVTRRCA